MTNPAALSTQVLIVGGGFSGIGLAMRLLERGHRDFVVLEKSTRLGGTWRDNTYPGCACDVPSVLYQYSNAPNPRWTRVFAEHHEIQAYTLDVAERFGVMPHVRLATELEHATWDERSHRWRVRTNTGDLEARYLVLAQGPLHEPRVPALPGLSDFQGTVFHSARWRHDVDLSGRRVAVIGTGSSAIQFVPKIQPRVAELVLFQRTAPWVLPKPDFAIPVEYRDLFARVPLAQRALRETFYGLTELLQLAERSPAAMHRLERLGAWHLERQVPDPELRAALTPSFTLGCKRLLLSNTYYPALTAPNVRVVAQGVTRVNANSVVSADGRAHEVDTIIFGTGFHVSDTSMPSRITGRGGVLLDSVWKKSPQAYLGTTVSGLPNAFFMLGPNSGNGHGSAFTIIEAQSNYIARAIELAEREGLTSLEVRGGAQRVWNDSVQAALAKTVWNAGGCKSWYLDETGRNSAIYPWTTIDMRLRMRKFDKADYEVRSARGARRAIAPIPLGGSVVAITGGAHGIGLETAKRFADAGAVVCIGDLDLAAARRATVGLGPRARAYALDVSKRESFARFVESVERDVGPIEVLVNNAGVMPTGRFLEEEDDAHAAAFGVNTFGVSLGMKLVLPRMIERGRGHVVNIASLAGKMPVPWMATYVASKHAVIGLTDAVRTEIDGTGVTLTTVMPGAVNTRLATGISLRGILAQEPSDVARAVVDSVRTRRTHVTVPSLLALAGEVFPVLPHRARLAIFRLFGAERLLATDAAEARRAYEDDARKQGREPSASTRATVEEVRA
ncbi:MAG: SDR family NAD(P)-dependent oxidoreductase [Polyangiaceae bacterium]